MLSTILDVLCVESYPFTSCHIYSHDNHPWNEYVDSMCTHAMYKVVQRAVLCGPVRICAGHSVRLWAHSALGVQSTNARSSESAPKLRIRSNSAPHPPGIPKSNPPHPSVCQRHAVCGMCWRAGALLRARIPDDI